MKLFVLILFISAYGQNLFAGEEPKILRKGDDITVIMNADIQKALKKWNPKAQILQLDQFSKEVKKLYTTEDLNSLPMATIGDFNGDSKKDLGLLVKIKNQLKAIMVLSKKSTYEIQVVKTFSLNDGDVVDVEAQKKGIFYSNVYLFTESSKNLKHKKGIGSRDGFQVEVLNSADTTVHYAIGNHVYEYKGLVK